VAVLIDCLDALREEFNTIAPDRDTSSDGWIGDAAHADRPSDHNPDETGATSYEDADSRDEVHAIDVDDTLRCDVSMEDCVQVILARCRSGQERRLHYIIYERRIWEDDDDWREQYYSGSNPHDQHAHFSACYESDNESDTSSWGLVEAFMGLTSEDKEWIDDRFKAYVGDVVDRWTAQGGRVPDSDPNPQQTVPSALFYAGADGAHTRYVQLVELQDTVDALSRAVQELHTAVTGGATQAVDAQAPDTRVVDDGPPL
jgi:hypothetical protein